MPSSNPFDSSVLCILSDIHQLAAMNVISIKEVINTIDSGAPFSCKVVSYDRKRKRGGTIKIIDEGRVARNDQIGSSPFTSGTGSERPLTKMEQLEAAKKKAPRHKKNYTRNVIILQEGMDTSLIEKIHPPLIIAFNGKQVLV